MAVSPFLTLADHIGALLFVRNLVRGSMTNKPSKSIHFKKSVKMDRIHLFEVGRVCLISLNGFTTFTRFKYSFRLYLQFHQQRNVRWYNQKFLEKTFF